MCAFLDETVTNSDPTERCKEHSILMIQF